MLLRWRTWARTLKTDAYALYLVFRDPRTPLPARLAIGLVVAYALSPIDLIPDFVPVLGLLDDLLIVPAGVALAVKLVPPSILAECRAEAACRFSTERPRSVLGAVMVASVWILGVLGAGYLVRF